MKKTIKLFGNVAVLATLFLASCSKENSNNPTPTPNAEPSIVANWQLNGGILDGYAVNKDQTSNTLHFRTDNKVERDLDLSYQSSCPPSVPICAITTYQYDKNDTIAYTKASNSITIEGKSWNYTASNSTLILFTNSSGFTVDSLNFSKL